MTHQTHQFKFGDRVQDAAGKQFVFLRSFLSSCTVAGDDGRTYDYLTNRLQPIRHPDAERIDWLAKNDCALTEMLCDDDGERLDTPFAVIQKQEEHFKVLAAANNIRQAIDAAMQEQAAEAKE